jgi:transposase
LRQLIDGIRFRVRTGGPWRDVPERYGSWQSVYGLFRAWQLAGVWAAILSGLQAAGAEAGVIDWIDWVVSVDSTINRAHAHAAGARRHPRAQVHPPVGEPADHAWAAPAAACHGGAPGGRAAAQDAGPGADGRSGRRQPQFTVVLGRIRVPHRSGPGRPRTDPGAGRQGLLLPRQPASLRRRGIPATIPVKADQQQHRGFATRYDMLAVRYEATVQITNINIWLRDSSNRS